MKKILIMPIMMLGAKLAVPVFQSSYAGGLSPIEAVIIITENHNKTVFFLLNITTVRVSGEILIANNSTLDHSVTSGQALLIPWREYSLILIKLNQRDLQNLLPKI